MKQKSINSKPEKAFSSHDSIKKHFSLIFWDTSDYKYIHYFFLRCLFAE